MNYFNKGLKIISNTNVDVDSETIVEVRESLLLQKTSLAIW